MFYSSIRTSNNSQVNKLTLTSDESTLIEDGGARSDGSLEDGDDVHRAIDNERMVSLTVTPFSLYAFPGFTLYHDDPYQLVQV